MQSKSLNLPEEYGHGCVCQRATCEVQTAESPRNDSNPMRCLNADSRKCKGTPSGRGHSQSAVVPTSQSSSQLVSASVVVCKLVPAWLIRYREMDNDMSSPRTDFYGSAMTSSSRPRIMRGVPISSWKPNERAIHCAICTKKFGFFRRKHHCRACGDVYCRRCLGFCLVDVPLAGVDISYTCIKCIRQHNSKPSLVEDLASLARSFDQSADTRVVRTRPDSASFVASPSSDVSTPATSPGSALTPCGSPGDWDIEYKVIVSQYHNPRLHSVCSLVGDFLECKGGAIVLIEDTHVWVIAHKGLRSRALHSGSFLSICHQAMKTNESFTASRERKQSTDPSKDPNGIFRFFGVAPIRPKDQLAKPIGCIVGLDTKPRDDITAKRVQKTLENLSRLVMNLLTEEQNILRIYTSGDFKIFASNSLDSASCNMSTFQRFGVPSPTSSLGASPVSRLELARSRSYEDSTNYDDLSFFARYAPDAPSMATEKLSSSNPEPHRKLVPMNQLRSPNQSMKSA